MPLTPAQEWAYWDNKATELRHGQLKTVQDAAAGWSKLFSALLGVFGTVAFAGGLTTLDKLAQPWAAIAKGGTLLAVVAAVLATIWAAQASQDLGPGKGTGLDAATLRNRSIAAATASLEKFGRARQAGFVAVSAVLAGSALILLAPAAKPLAESPSVLVVTNGQAQCGRLTRSDGGVLQVDGVSLDRYVQQISVVERCP